MYSDYNAKNLNVQETRELIYTNDQGVSTYKVSQTQSIKREKGRVSKMISIHTDIPYTKDGKKVLDIPFHMVLEEIGSIRLMSRFAHICQQLMTEFNVIETTKPFYKVLASILSCNPSMGTKIVRDLIEYKIMRKVNHSKFIVNPYVVFNNYIGAYRLGELQAHWDAEVEPTRWLSKEEIDAIAKSLISSVKEQADDISEKIEENTESSPDTNDYDIKEDDYERLEKAKEENKYFMSIAFARFSENPSVIDKIGQPNPVELTRYVSTDAGARHFRNWYLNTYSDKINIEFKYVDRNKYVKYFLDNAPTCDR